MQLPLEEIQRRIVAARTLLDISQDEMTVRGHEAYGLRRTELARVERGTRKLEPYHLRVLADVLEVPLAWFTEPREVIVQVPVRDMDGLLGVLERWMRDQGTGAAGTG